MLRRHRSELDWAARSLSFRLALLKRFRHRLVEQRDSVLTLLEDLRPGSTRAELISSELIPLLDNCQFLESRSAGVLAPQELGRKGRPAWLFGLDSVIYREALGRILIVAPSNYPLFLPLVQALYAWAAGNTVWLKSAPRSGALHQRMHELFVSVGGQPELFRLLGESPDAYTAALAEGVQKVVLVGSAETAERVLAQAGQALVPAVAELSGWDSVFVHPDADLPFAAQAIAFGLALNGGRTCVAPRRIFFRGDVERFEGLLREALDSRPRVLLSESERAQIRMSQLLGCRLIGGEHGPVVVSRTGRSHPLLREPSFGALAVLLVVDSDEQALEVAHDCDFALGASLFGPQEWCRSLAHRVPAQVVTVNDMIVASADPRIPFGGSGRSGFGRMRGAEGLLEMTKTRTVSIRTGGSLDHLRPPTAADEPILERFLLLSHSSSVLARLRALSEMIFVIARERIRRRRQSGGVAMSGGASTSGGGPGQREPILQGEHFE